MDAEGVMEVNDDFLEVNEQIYSRGWIGRPE